MTESKWSDRLLKFKNKLPQALLFLRSKSDTSEDFLKEAASILTGTKFYEGSGDFLILKADDQYGSIKIKLVRDLISNLSLRSWNPDRPRFVLIPNADQLTIGASNALLKSLEEPPVGTHFLFQAPSRKNLLTTIVSRCFAINVNEAQKPSLHEESQSKGFPEAFFENNFDTLAALGKNDFKYNFDLFKSELVNKFMDIGYNIEKEERKRWFDLLNFLDVCEKQIESHADQKWIVDSIGQFNNERV